MTSGYTPTPSTDGNSKPITERVRAIMRSGPLTPERCQQLVRTADFEVLERLRYTGEYLVYLRGALSGNDRKHLEDVRRAWDPTASWLDAFLLLNSADYR